MDILKGFFFVVLISKCAAHPTPKEDLSIYFDYADTNARLVGGTQAAVGSHPHMMAMAVVSSIFQITVFHCGASIITARHVLSAAHCVEFWYLGGTLTSSLRGIVGTNRWNSGGVHYRIIGNVTHPNYIEETNKNDIAFMITSSDIRFSILVAPISLNYDFIGGDVPVQVAGWGNVIFGTPSISPTLLEINTRTIDEEKCVVDSHEAFLAIGHPVPPVVVEPQIEICTFHSVGVGNCHGDSGSPLIDIVNNQQVGIVSWAVQCAVGGPDVYVRVSAYRDWILNIIG